jgi:hypothetical protein
MRSLALPHPQRWMSLGTGLLDGCGRAPTRREQVGSALSRGLEKFGRCAAQLPPLCRSDDRDSIAVSPPVNARETQS